MTKASCSDERERKLHDAANAIVERLFRNGNGQIAERLVLAMPDGKDGGGWGRGAVRRVILKQLTMSGGD